MELVNIAKLVAAWLLVLIITTGFAWQIVRAADSRLNAPPATVVADPLPTSSASTSTTVDNSIVGSTSTTFDTLPTSSTTTTMSTPATSPPTTVPATSPSPSPTTTETEEWTLRTIPTGGGTVVVRHRPEEVEFVSATPAAGFETELEDAGPPKVRVSFESEEYEFEIRVEWHDGKLEVDIEES